MLLVLTLLALTLAAALIAPLAGWSGLHALQAHDPLLAIQHDLAVESLAALLPALLNADRDLNAALDRENAARVEFEMGNVNVSAILQDDSAKLPLGLAIQQMAGRPARNPLAELQVAIGLPHMPMRWTEGAPQRDAGPRSTSCLEDAFEEATDRAIYGTPDDSHSWSRFVSSRNGPIHARRAAPVVLEAALADLEPGLGMRLSELLRAGKRECPIEEVIGDLNLGPKMADRLRSRLTSETLSYSLLIRTVQQGRARRSYAILEANGAQRPLSVWEVAP